MEKPKKGYNVFFDPYEAVTVGTMPDIKIPFCEPLPEWWDLPWKGPAVGMLTKLTGDLEGIPFEAANVNQVNKGTYPNTDKRRAYQREYMRRKRRASGTA